MNVYRLFALACSTVFLGVAARAQIELPEQKIKPPAQDRAPEVPELHAGSLAGKMGVSIRSRPVPSQGRDQLDLPSRRPVAPAPSPTPAPSSAPTEPAPVAPQPSTAPTKPADIGSTAGADFVLAEVARLHSHDDPLIDHAVQSLLRMGDIGRLSASRSLASEHVPTLMAAAKTLLSSGVSSDCELVQERLRAKLPNAACGLLVDTLCALDPVHASPAFLTELLSHRQGAVRAAAQRHLGRLGSELKAATLIKTLRGKDADARLRAVQLLSSTDDDAVVELLLERMTDANATVARRAVESLAVHEDPRIENELLRRAFEDPWVVRTGAYALLALCEREDRRVSSILTSSHAPHLLRGLSSNDPFVAGCCACALAGIGFRSSAVSGVEWLDLDVPHRLVRAVSAEDFSADFSALVPTATRRLALIAGQNFGSEGPKWIAWWSAHAETFKAARATLPVGIEAASEMVVLASSDEDTALYSLVGPRAKADARALVGETIQLSDSQARALFEVFRGAGLFASERLPGVRGSSFEPGRTLTVQFGARSKSFRFATAAAEPWFATAFEATRNVRERNRWQRHFDPRAHADFQAFWDTEAPWWDVTTDEPERARRLWELALTRVDGLPIAQRDASTLELRELARSSGVIAPTDFTALVRLLGQERFVGPRARGWLELAIMAGSSVDEEMPGEPRLGEAYATELIDTLIATFDTTAVTELSQVMRAAGRPFGRALIADPRPFVRAVAAATIARDSETADVELLRGLIRDPEDRVVAAALLALGENKVDASRADILGATRSIRPEIRIAALRAAGLLGGEDVLSTLLIGLADSSDERFAPAAAEGIAAMRDPGNVPVLMNLLARGPDDACYGSARHGVLALGEAAWDALLRASRSPTGTARREAALLLSEQLVPQVTSVLLTMLTESPRDARLAEELAVLSCVDNRREADPANAWWRWWEFVVHDDAQSWMLGALARLGLPGPPPEDIRAGTPDALRFLEALAAREEPFLAERARREFARLSGRDPGPLPARGIERDAWVRTLCESLEARSQR